MKQLPRVITVKNIMRMILIGVVCVLCIMMTSCSPRYTEAQARKLFGCKTDSIHIDSTTTHHVDTFTNYITIPGDTVTVSGPCEEIVKMKSGEKKIKESKSKRTISEYGKDSTGQSYFKCFAQEYKDSMEWYRDTWRTTVHKTIFQSNQVEEPSRWQSYFNMAKNAMCVIGILAVLLLIIKYRSDKT